MSSDNLNLFVVINESKLFFVAGKPNENQNLKLLKNQKLITNTQI